MRAAYYHSLRQDGAISGEDIRRMENFAPSGQPAADELLVALNMLPASAFRENGLTLSQPTPPSTCSAPDTRPRL
jgi:hypothetical protein